MNLQISEIVFFIGFVVYVVTRGVFAHRTKTIETIEKRNNKTDNILLVLVMIGSLLIPILYLFTPILDFANYRLPMWALWTGAVVMFVALWLFRRSHLDLGINWSPTLEIRKEHRLVTHGVYCRIRHPMYAAILTWSVAQALLLNNWFAGFSALVTFLPLYFVRLPREEQMMRDRFGAEYEAYASQSGRLFPPLGRVS